MTIGKFISEAMLWIGLLFKIAIGAVMVLTVIWGLTENPAGALVALFFLAVLSEDIATPFNRDKPAA